MRPRHSGARREDRPHLRSWNTPRQEAFVETLSRRQIVTLNGCITQAARMEQSRYPYAASGRGKACDACFSSRANGRTQPARLRTCHANAAERGFYFLLHIEAVALSVAV